MTDIRKGVRIGNVPGLKTYVEDWGFRRVMDSEGRRIKPENGDGLVPLEYEDLILEGLVFSDGQTDATLYECRGVYFDKAKMPRVRLRQVAWYFSGIGWTLPSEVPERVQRFMEKWEDA